MFPQQHRKRAVISREETEPFLDRKRADVSLELTEIRRTSERGEHVNQEVVDMTDALELALTHSPTFLQFQDLGFCSCTCCSIRDIAPILALLHNEPKAARNLGSWGLRFPLKLAVSRCAALEVVVAMVETDYKRGLHELNHYYFCCTRRRTTSEAETELKMKQKHLIESAWTELNSLSVENLIMLNEGSPVPYRTQSQLQQHMRSKHR
jgi:hypothetical protein